MIDVLKTFRTLGLAAAATLGLASAAQAYDAVAAADLNMRAGPGTHYAVLDVIPFGEPVAVGRCSGSWCRVDFDGLQGWTSSRYLDEITYRRAPIVRGPRVVRAPRVHEPMPYVKPGPARLRTPYYGHPRSHRVRPYERRYEARPGVSVGLDFGDARVGFSLR